MQQIASGDRRAFAALFDRYQASVVRFCHRFSNDRARADDLSQEIFVKLYRAAPTWRPDARLKTFLFRIATNHCLNALRAEPRARARPAGADAGPGGGGGVGVEEAAGSSPEQAVAGNELEEVVRRTLLEMPERERAAFAMARFEGMSYREIAQALSATESAVKSLVHRATVAMATAVAAHDSGNSEGKTA